ncbi:hypothetical protein K1719_034769 [Acacia pycnantha]|nr:hypothetical protein K1719_034769 [Acacia pycnantha]
MYGKSPRQGLCEEDTTKALAPRFIERDQITQPHPHEGKEHSRKESARGINAVVLAVISGSKEELVGCSAHEICPHPPSQLRWLGVIELKNDSARAISFQVQFSFVS